MSSSSKSSLILASSSPRRLELLVSFGVTPDKIIPADIDESLVDGELPRPFALRMAIEKAQAIKQAIKNETGNYILAGDTIVAMGRRIFSKPEDEAQARKFLGLMSGRSHRVYSGICVVDPMGAFQSRVVETRLKMKRLSKAELDTYIASNEWRGKAGAYGIQGVAGAYISQIIGSYSNVVGLPVYETRNLLKGAGYEC
ncbi:MAG: Maf family nucleotide pyrophosphatase [Robiginitomaculum sp.]